jgi:two-component system, cell cycle response regulator
MERVFPGPHDLDREQRMNDAVQNLQVLVVDDSPVCRKLVQQALKQETYEMLFAESGAEALKLYERHAPSIVITDWMMPDFSGLELCQRIRADLRRKYTYIILLTSISEKDNVVKGLAAGADDYLTKPFDPAELIARIGVGRRIVDLHREIEAKNQLLEGMAHTDPLTGLPNRRAIEDWAARQLRGAARHGFPFWVVLADLDAFKSVNDNYGHDAGDAVLKAFAEALKEHTRASDLCGRLGGDEFLMVMTHVGEEDIQPTVDHFREQFARQEFCFEGKKARVTASFGIAGFHGKGEPEFSALLRRADKALYGAKHAGGNQVKMQAAQRA